MPASPTTLDQTQADIVAVIKATHETLILARQTRAAELSRRIAAAKLAAKQEYERRIAQIETVEKLRIDAEIAEHAAAQDEALIAAWNANVPIRRMALDGFGNQYDGAVQQLLAALRDDGRIGSKRGYQRNNTPADEITPTIAFPEPIDVESVLEERTNISEPVFEEKENGLMLVEESAPGANDGIQVNAVTITMDPRDPWFASIAKNARPGTPYAKATTATLYLQPHSGELAVFESQETGDIYWDHPVARWVKEHPIEALDGFMSVANNVA